MARMPGLQDVSSDLQIKTPRVNIVLDRDRAAALNLNWNNISSTLYDAFGPQFASTIYAPTNQYRVLLEMLPQYQQHTDGLDMIYLKIGHRDNWCRSTPWPSLKTDAGPQSIPHSGQLPSVTISFALQARHFARPGDGRDRGGRAKHNLPATITGSLPGHRQGVPGFHAATWASC